MRHEVPKVQPGEPLTDLRNGDPRLRDQVIVDGPAELRQELVEASNSPTVTFDAP